MGWIQTLLLGELSDSGDCSTSSTNQNKIISGRSSKRRIAQQMQEKDKEIEFLKNELGRQKLAIQALTRYLIENTTVNEVEFNQFIYEVDKEDGIVDGKLNIDPTTRKLKFSNKKVIPSRMVQRPHPNRK